MPESLVKLETWRSQWERAEIIHGLPFADELTPSFPKTPGASFLEIGCSPGGILADICSRLGYAAYGIDPSCDSQRICDRLEAAGVTIGRIWAEDVFAWKPQEPFDIVASFGFIEHFVDAEAAIARHFDLVKPRGTVLIGVPHFAHGQWLLHRIFDEEMLNGHNVHAMTRRFLRSATARCGALNIRVDYVGGHFAFWLSGRTRRSRFRERAMWQTLRAFKVLARHWPGTSNPLFSPYLWLSCQAPADTRAEI
jgi:2-polyprenyl-3-methyl-5-hydroxy-6-metoxy-1,4-benzoquinol methylase